MACVKGLALLAKRYDIGLNTDAEEADRLELSLDLLEALALDPALAQLTLDAIGLGDLFQAADIIGRDEVAPKPAPDGLHYFLGRWGITAAQAVLAWHVARGVTPIPKSANSHRQVENLASQAVLLSPAEVDATGMKGDAVRATPRLVPFGALMERSISG